MRIYLDRGHRPYGGAVDEWRQVGVFIDELERCLLAQGCDVIRTPDELDSYAGQRWALAHLGHHPEDSALYLACHADSGATCGHVFFDDHSANSEHWAEIIAQAMPYRTVCTPTSTPGYERTPGMISLITQDERRICGVLLELWTVGPAPPDEDIIEDARCVAEAL